MSNDTIDMNQRLVRTDFVNQMQYELACNEVEKGNWKDWEPSPFDALQELQWHNAKLGRAMKEPQDPRKISEYAADIANIVMKISDFYGIELKFKGNPIDGYK